MLMSISRRSGGDAPRAAREKRRCRGLGRHGSRREDIYHMALALIYRRPAAEAMSAAAIDGGPKRAISPDRAAAAAKGR